MGRRARVADGRHQVHRCVGVGRDHPDLVGARELVALIVEGVGGRDPARCRRSRRQRRRHELANRVVARGRLVGGLCRERGRTHDPGRRGLTRGDSRGVAVGRHDRGRVPVRVVAVARRGRGGGAVSGRHRGQLSAGVVCVPGVVVRPAAARRRSDGLDQVARQVVGVGRRLVAGWSCFNGWTPLVASAPVITRPGSGRTAPGSSSPSCRRWRHRCRSSRPWPAARRSRRGSSSGTKPP